MTAEKELDLVVQKSTRTTDRPHSVRVAVVVIEIGACTARNGKNIYLTNDKVTISLELLLKHF